MADRLFDQVRSLSGDQLDDVLTRNLARFSLALRARRCMRALAHMAHNNRDWAGQQADIAAEAARLSRAAFSKETAGRALKDLERAGLIDVHRTNGAASAYSVRWDMLLGDPSTAPPSAATVDRPPLPAEACRDTAAKWPRQLLLDDQPTDAPPADAATPGIVSRVIGALAGLLTARRRGGRRRILTPSPAAPVGSSPPPRSAAADRGQPPSHSAVTPVTAATDRGQNPGLPPSEPPSTVVTPYVLEMVTKEPSPLVRAPAPSERSAPRTEPERSTAPRLVWGRTVDEAELRDPDKVLGLYRVAVIAGVANPTYADQLAFVALAVHVLRQPNVKNRVGLLGRILDGTVADRFVRKDWRARPTNGDEDLARQWLRRVELDEQFPQRRDAYLAQLQEEHHAAKADAARKRDYAERLKREFVQ